MKKSYQAGGWLPEGAHLELEWDDQGRDMATNWGGVLQAPGDWECLEVLSDQPFPDGFGPDYPIIFIHSGEFAGNAFYAGHTSTRVQPGDKGGFGHPLAVADQGHNWAGTTGGWIELGQAFYRSDMGMWLPGPKTGRKWFDSLLEKPLVLNFPDPPLIFGDQGLRVLGMTSDLRDCGWLDRPYWHFNREVHGAVVAFKSFHRLPVRGTDRGVVDEQTAASMKHTADWCKKNHRLDGELRFGDQGWRVLGVTSDLRDCGWLDRPWFVFNPTVHGAVVAYKQYHRIPMPPITKNRKDQQDRGVVNLACATTIHNSAVNCKKHKKKEH